ncbi:tRNA lysidine(34) synthetase TilS [Hazenella coriacea]|uniref:tRNA(Ile)-lysidine synthase n=1 Tax=Hazenella coriacea TaxID=1179467 RepID=A0A4R3L4N6_9BACL|nr:tRNA lysidine(34) synthetase TilS [Hazenella coriacea]TCS94282.1 tRNA(Ile)-lysidine synthase [Hazenella coriacea]
MFLEQLKQQIEQQQLFNHGEKLLVAVSGGPDSMALLYGLHQLSRQNDWKLFVVHVNHQLRGADSEQDEEYVCRKCKDWNIPYAVDRIDVVKQVQQTGENKQAVSRKLRYESFLQVAKKWDIHTCVLAHHADDQVETVLMRLIRGTGVQGLTGIQQVRHWRGLRLVRPLLHVSREMIENYCEQEFLEPRMDLSNLSTEYTRNRVRLELIPLLKSYNPQMKQSILQLSDLVRDEEEVWDDLVQKSLSEILLKKEKDYITIALTPFLQLPVALQRRTVKLILNCYLRQGVHEATLESVEQVRYVAAHNHPSVTVHLPGDWVAQKEYQVLHLQKKTKGKRVSASKSVHDKISLSIPGVTSLEGLLGKIEVIVSNKALSEIDSCCDWAVFDAEQLLDRLYVRSRQPGDRMTCIGMDGTKKLKNLFMEAKIPRQHRHVHPVVLSGETIIWVPGIRRSKDAQITSKTKSYLTMRWIVE